MKTIIYHSLYCTPAALFIQREPSQVEWIAHRTRYRLCELPPTCVSSELMRDESSRCWWQRLWHQSRWIHPELLQKPHAQHLAPIVSAWQHEQHSVFCHQDGACILCQADGSILFLLAQEAEQQQLRAELLAQHPDYSELPEIRELPAELYPIMPVSIYQPSIYDRDGKECFERTEGVTLLDLGSGDECSYDLCYADQEREDSPREYAWMRELVSELQRHLRATCREEEMRRFFPDGEDPLDKGGVSLAFSREGQVIAQLIDSSFCCGCAPYFDDYTLVLRAQSGSAAQIEHVLSELCAQHRSITRRASSCVNS